MSDDLTFNWDNFVSELVFHPDHAKEGTDRNKAWAATLAIGVLTAGFAYALIGLYQVGSYFYNTQFKQKEPENLNKADQKTQLLFNDTHPDNYQKKSTNTSANAPDPASGSKPSTTTTAQDPFGEKPLLPDMPDTVDDPNPTVPKIIPQKPGIAELIAVKKLVAFPDILQSAASAPLPPQLKNIAQLIAVKKLIALPDTVQTAASAPLPPQPKKLADASPPYAPDPAILQYVLADYVGGGEGNTLENGIAFYQHYFEEYCEIKPTDTTAAAILNNLSSYFPPSLTDPLEKVTEEIINKLTKDRYVAIPGGYYQEAEGHGILYELILESNHTVTFRMTNSGEGLQYHPKDSSSIEQTHSTREWRYRTPFLLRERPSEI